MRFGRGRNIVGVLHEPDDRRQDAPVVLLLNAGLLHRVGPHRLNVDLARRLGQLGFPSLRFDMSGIGDSTMQDEELPYVDRSLRDIGDAMDAVDDRLGSSDFVLIGLCSGAFNALRAAVADERVDGCVFLDGYSFPTLRYRVRHYAPRLLSEEKWRRYIRRKLGRGPSNGESDDLIVFETEIVPKDRFHNELSTLIERGTRMLFVYTGGGPQPFNYPNQLRDAFPDLDFDRSSKLVWFPESDHTYTLPGHRAALISVIEEWFDSEFEGALA